MAKFDSVGAVADGKNGFGERAYGNFEDHRTDYGLSHGRELGVG